MTPAEAARLLGISRSKVYEMLGAGELPSISIGRRQRIAVDALRRWLAEQLG